MRRASRCVRRSFNLAIEMLVISGKNNLQAARKQTDSFNLAIEMLVISGFEILIEEADLECFNLAIEMLVISGSIAAAVDDAPSVSISQSRCLSFQEQRDFASEVISALFQSRNRDACHFRVTDWDPSKNVEISFNLAIEMLVISGPCPRSP